MSRHARLKARGSSRLLPLWLLACVAAGALARSTHPHTLIVSGPLFGLGQWLALRAAARRPLRREMLLWAPASALGGLVAYLNIGSWMVTLLRRPLTDAFSPYHNYVSHVLFLSVLWAGIGLAQWPLLRPIRRRAAVWIGWSAAGGALGALCDMAYDLAFGTMLSSPVAGALAGAGNALLTGVWLRRGSDSQIETGAAG